jgi:hypothetical protein
MHSYTHNLLPISFHHMWTLNRARIIQNIFFVMLTNYMSLPIIMPHLKECRCSISPVHGIKKESKSLILSSIVI